MKYRRRRLVAGVFALTLVGVACGDDDKDTSATDAPAGATDAPAGSEAPAATDTPAATEAGRRH